MNSAFNTLRALAPVAETFAMVAVKHGRVVRNSSSTLSMPVRAFASDAKKAWEEVAPDQTKQKGVNVVQVGNLGEHVPSSMEARLKNDQVATYLTAHSPSDNWVDISDRPINPPKDGYLVLEEFGGDEVSPVSEMRVNDSSNTPGAVYGPVASSGGPRTAVTEGGEKSGGKEESSSSDYTSEAKEWGKCLAIVTGAVGSVYLAREIAEKGKVKQALSQFLGESMGITSGFVLGGTVGHGFRRAAAVHATNPYLSIKDAGLSVIRNGATNGLGIAVRNTTYQGGIYAGASAATMALLDTMCPVQDGETPTSKTLLGAVVTGTVTAVGDTVATVKADRIITQQALRDIAIQRAKDSGMPAEGIRAMDTLTGKPLEVGTAGPVRVQGQFMFARNYLLALTTFGLNSAYRSLSEEVKENVSPGALMGAGVFTYNVTVGGLLNQFKSFAQGTAMESATSAQVAYRAAEVILGVDKSSYRPLDNPPSIKEAALKVTEAIGKHWPAMIKSNLHRGAFTACIAYGIGTCLNGFGGSFVESDR